jgi:DNA-binding MltR family transcriptional regulator
MADITIRSLTELDDESAALYDAVNDQRDIACVLISTSYIDQFLRSILGKYFIDGETSKSLLKYTGMVGDLHSRAQLAYCLGLIPKGLFQNLERLGNIRNAFAHDHLEKTFGDDEIVRLCGQLIPPKMTGIQVNGQTDESRNMDGLPDELLSTPRNRFVSIVTMMIGRLFAILDGIEKRAEVTKGWN